MRFVHTADWQLGMTRHFLAGDAQPRYSAARRDAVAGLGALAAEVGAEFVVVAGDVFEHNQLAPQVISQSLEAMRAIGIPVYLLPGNHDPLDASSVYTSALFTAECPDNVVVLDRAGVHQVRPGLEIVAAPWRSKAPTTDLVAEALEGLEPGPVTRVLVAHGGVDVLDPDRDKPSLIRLAALDEALARGALHYVALGDKHSRTRVGGSGRVWYSGSPEVTNFDDVESDPGHVLVVDIDESDHARHRYGKARRPLAVRHTAPPGGHQPRHRRPGHESGPDDRQGTHRGAAGADRLVDGHRPRRAGRVPGPIRAVVRLAGAVGTPHRPRGGARRRRIHRPRHRRVRGRRRRGAGRHGRADDADAALDAQAALALLLRLADRGAA